MDNSSSGGSGGDGGGSRKLQHRRKEKWAGHRGSEPAAELTRELKPLVGCVVFDFAIDENRLLSYKEPVSALFRPRRAEPAESICLSYKKK